MILLTPSGPIALEPAPGFWGHVQLRAYRRRDLEQLFPGAALRAAGDEFSLIATHEAALGAIASLLEAPPLLQAIGPADGAYRNLIAGLQEVLAEAMAEEPSTTPPATPSVVITDAADPYDGPLPSAPTICETAAAAGQECPLVY